MINQFQNHQQQKMELIFLFLQKIETLVMVTNVNQSNNRILVKS